MNIIAGFLVFQKVFAFSLFRDGLEHFNSGDLNRAEKSVSNSLDLSSNDFFYRTLSEIYLEQILRIATSGENSDRLDGLITSAVGSADLAISYNPLNHENWLQRAVVLKTLSIFGVQNTSGLADSAFDKASELDPQNPFIDLVRARLEAESGSLENSKQYVLRAISKKPNYGSAILFRSQLESSEGKLKEAISSILQTISIEPQNPFLYFQLGLLYYHDKDFLNSSIAFESATRLDPQYANAKYFLGLSLSELGQNEQASAIFGDLLKDYPGNEELKNILENLMSGREPLFDSPSEVLPEEREDLPIEEE